jgi:hypothetical protein
MVVDKLADGLEEVLDIAENSSAETFFGQVSEEAFDHIEPRTTGGSEVDVEPFPPADPARHCGMFVCRVVVHDEVYLPVFWRQFVDDSQERSHS